MGANAVTSVPVYASGDVLTAANLNITNSGVPVFATTAARDAAFGGSGEKTLAEGQVCYREATPKNLQVYNGTTWVALLDVAVVSYTPTLTNVTLGNGSINGVYQRISNYVAFGVHLSFGSTTSVSGLIGISLPFTASSGANTRTWLNAGFSDTGTTQYNGIGTIAESGTRINFYAILASGTYTSIAGSPTSATVPFTWASTDEIYVSGVYRYAV